MNKFVKDLTERVAATFLVVLVPLLGADGANVVAGLDWGKTLLIAGSAALLSLLKGLLAKLKGDPDSASLTSLRTLEPAYRDTTR